MSQNEFTFYFYDKQKSEPKEILLQNDNNNKIVNGGIFFFLKGQYNTLC